MSTLLTDLEQKLSAPGGGALRDDLLTQTDRLEQQLRTRIAQGLPRDEFMAWQAVFEAVRVAHDILSGWPVNDASAHYVSTEPFSRSFPS